MKKFYVVSAALFVLGIGLIILGAWFNELVRDPQTRANWSVDRESVPDLRFWSPILWFSGGLMAICGALAFVSTFGTHVRQTAKIPPSDSML